MRILFDIVRAADVLFFSRPIRALRARGHDVLVCSRQKGIVCDLLDRLSIDHEPVSSATDGKVGAAMELLLRDAAIAATARDFCPHAMIGFGGVSIAHAGAVLGIPSIAFQDTEGAALQARLTWPAISQIYVPECYRGKVPEAKTHRLAGVKELSYFHPNAFTPDRSLAIANGLDPDRQNIFIRLVSWTASHQLGKKGWTPKDVKHLVDAYGHRMKLNISSKGPLPEAFQAHAYRGDPETVHHLLGHCALYIGESATMASEAAILGVRSAYGVNDYRSSITELGSFGLVSHPMRDARVDIWALAESQLYRSDEKIKKDLQAYLLGKPDWSDVVLKSLAPYAPAQRRAMNPKVRRAG
ncbi:MAG: DUF354 domain-containing protein [Pseudomonadota bacterium]